MKFNANQKMYQLHCHMRSDNIVDTYFFQYEVAEQDAFLRTLPKRSDYEWVSYWHDNVILPINENNIPTDGDWWTTEKCMQFANWLVKRHNFDVQQIMDAF